MSGGMSTFLIIFGVVAFICWGGISNVLKSKQESAQDAEDARELAKRIARHPEIRRHAVAHYSAPRKSTVHFEPSPVKPAPNNLPALVYSEDLDMWLPETGELPEYAAGVMANKNAALKLQLAEAHENMAMLAKGLKLPAAPDEAE